MEICVPRSGRAYLQNYIEGGRIDLPSLCPGSKPLAMAEAGPYVAFTDSMEGTVVIGVKGSKEKATRYQGRLAEARSFPFIGRKEYRIVFPDGSSQELKSFKAGGGKSIILDNNSDRPFYQGENKKEYRKTLDAR